MRNSFLIGILFISLLSVSCGIHPNLKNDANREYKNISPAFIDIYELQSVIIDEASLNGEIKQHIDNTFKLIGFSASADRYHTPSLSKINSLIPVIHKYARTQMKWEIFPGFDPLRYRCQYVGFESQGKKYVLANFSEIGASDKFWINKYVRYAGGGESFFQIICKEKSQIVVASGFHH